MKAASICLRTILSSMRLLILTENSNNILNKLFFFVENCNYKSKIEIIYSLNNLIKNLSYLNLKNLIENGILEILLLCLNIDDESKLSLIFESFRILIKSTLNDFNLLLKLKNFFELNKITELIKSNSIQNQNFLINLNLFENSLQELYFTLEKV